MFRVEIIAPDGTSIKPGAGAEESTGEAFRVLRVVPSDVLGGAAAAGQWQAVLSVDGRKVKSWLSRQRKRFGDSERGKGIVGRLGNAISTHGVPFTLSVQARSALTMNVAISQKSRLPGTTADLWVSLTDSGVPLGSSGAVQATVTAPDGTNHVVVLHETEPGVHQGHLPTSAAGVYRVLVRGYGSDLRGTKFTREELRTVAVWARGDDAPPVVLEPGTGEHTGLDACGLLLCLLGDDGIQNWLKRQEIDPDAVARCVKRACG